MKLSNCLHQLIIGSQSVSSQEPGSSQHAQRVVTKGNLWIKWRAQPSGGEVADTVKWIDELEEFFVNYHNLEGKKYELLGTNGVAEALRLIRKARSLAK